MQQANKIYQISLKIWLYYASDIYVESFVPICVCVYIYMCIYIYIFFSYLLIQLYFKKHKAC